MRIFFDIETVRGRNAPSLDEIPLGALKKESSIKAFLDDPKTLENAWNKQALNSMKGRIISVAWAIEDDPVKCVASDDTSEIFDCVLEDLKRTDRPLIYTWVGHNSDEFDLPFMFHQSLKINHEIKMYLPASKDYKEDTMKMWAQYRYKQFYSMKSIAEFLGIDNPDDTDGSMVGEFYKRGDLESIIEHNKNDVEVLRKIYKRIKL